MYKSLLAVLLAVFALSGCASVMETSLNKDKELYTAQNQNLSINVARDIALANIPACQFKAAPGETMTFGGIQEISCYGGNFGGGSGGNTTITQRESPAWDFLHSQGNNIFGALTTCLLFGACGFGGTGALPSVGPSPETILIPTQVIEQPVIYTPPAL